jgi:hypothetical protein
MGKSIEVLQKVKNGTTVLSNNPTYNYISQGNKISVSIHSSQEMENPTPP